MTKEPQDNKSSNNSNNTSNTENQNKNKKESKAVSTKNTAKPAEKPAQAQTSSGPGWFVTVLILLIALAGLGGSAWLWYQQQEQEQEQEKIELAAAAQIESNETVMKQQLQSQLDSNRKVQRQVDQLASASKQQTQTVKEEIASLRNQLRAQQKRISSLSSTDRTDWLLAEVEYLIRLANQRLLMGGEIKGAASLLKAADDIVVEIDDTALYPVRKALADNLAALRTAGKLDTEGLYLQLGGLAKQADALRLFKMPELNTVPIEKEVEANWQHRVKNSLNATLARLSTYVQVNRREENYQPVLAPQYESAVRQNVRLMFEQSQMAVLSGNQRLYNDSIAKATQWLNSYYTLDGEKARLIAQQLDLLAQETITVELPDISSSLRALKNYIETIHNAPTSLKKRKTVQAPVGMPANTSKTTVVKKAKSGIEVNNKPVTELGNGE